LPDEPTGATVTAGQQDPASDDAEGLTSPEGVASGAPQGEPAASGAEGQQLSPAELEARLRKLTSENRGLRNAKGAAENKLKAIEDAQKTEAERLSERLTALEAENSKLKADQQRAALQQVVTRHGAKPHCAELVADALEREGLERDEHGRPTNVEALLPAVRSRYPELFQATNGLGSIDATAGRGSPASARNWFDQIMRPSAT
jgi:hypothetical protein